MCMAFTPKQEHHMAELGQDEFGHTEFDRAG
jgi:hypothetical protein